jgi:hypothetical protein
MEGKGMLVRMVCCVALSAVMLAPDEARADCAQEISRLMSKDTEKLTTRYNRIVKQTQHKATPKLIAEECKIARQLQPRLEDQIAALKQSDCSKDPQVGSMIADIMRGHADDLAAARRSVDRCR